MGNGLEIIHFETLILILNLKSFVNTGQYDVILI